jgi:hypothetical protein
VLAPSAIKSGIAHVARHASASKSEVQR